MQRISLCLIARDEEELLPGCLASVQGLVDEIVVADTGSTDRTVEIALAAGAILVEHVWQDNFSAARNAALSAATGDWILVLDADERLYGPGHKNLRATVESGKLDCGMLAWHNASRMDATAEEILRGEARLGEPVLVPRLFRHTPDLRWHGLVHEHVNPWLHQRGGRGRIIEAPILHYGAMPSIRKERGKDDRNLRLLRKEIDLAPDNWMAKAYLAEGLFEASRPEEAVVYAEEAWGAVRQIVTRTGTPPCGSTKTASILSALRVRQGDFSAALTVLRAARRLGIRHPNVDYISGLAHENLALRSPNPEAEKDHLARARECYAAALSHNHRHFVDCILEGAVSWASECRLGIVLLQEGDAARALASFDRALEVNPGYREAVLGKAEALLDLEEPTAALALLSPDEDSCADEWLLAAEAHRQLMNRQAFDACVERAYALARSSLKGLHRLALLNDLVRLAS